MYILRKLITISLQNAVNIAHKIPFYNEKLNLIYVTKLIKIYIIKIMYVCNPANIFSRIIEHRFIKMSVYKPR